MDLSAHGQDDRPTGVNNDVTPSPHILTKTKLAVLLAPPEGPVKRLPKKTKKEEDKKTKGKTDKQPPKNPSQPPTEAQAESRKPAPQAPLPIVVNNPGRDDEGRLSDPLEAVAMSENPPSEVLQLSSQLSESLTLAPEVALDVVVQQEPDRASNAILRKQDQMAKKLFTVPVDHVAITAQPLRVLERRDKFLNKFSPASYRKHIGKHQGVRRRTGFDRRMALFR
jgi:hypothetical protein